MPRVQLGAGQVILASGAAGHGPAINIYVNRAALNAVPFDQPGKAFGAGHTIAGSALATGAAMSGKFGRVYTLQPDSAPVTIEGVPVDNADAGALKLIRVTLSGGKPLPA